MEVTIRAFNAPADPEACLKFIDGHRRLLEIHFGIAKITSSNVDWMYHDNTYVIVAESSDGSKVYGGARVQVSDNKLQLPIETAVSKYDPRIHDLAAQPNVSEVCGLWNSMEVAGKGIGSVFMGRVGVVIASLLKVDKILFLAAPITVRMGKRMGAVVETSVGNSGTFFYPKDDFVATAMAINDCGTLSSADPLERARIFNLVENPTQKAIENGPKMDLIVDYQLDVTKP